VSGPSGAGKGTLVERLLPCFPWIEPTVSATTRPPRPGEVDGRHYHFLDQTRFMRHVERGDFLEYVDYSGRWYGTLRSEVERILDRGRAPLLEIELYGARAVRAAVPDALAVFITAPSKEALLARLTGRATETDEAIMKRMRTAEIEMDARHEFDCVIVNDTVDVATRELVHAVSSACGAEDPCDG
jgi:guanylate kinase